MDQMNSKFSAKAIKQFVDSIPCEELSGGIVRTCPVRISYPFLAEPSEPMDKNGKPRYGLTLLFPKGADLDILEDACKAAAAKTWGPDWEEDIAPVMPFRDQHENPKQAKKAGHVKGAVWFRATSIEKPQVVDRTGKEMDAAKVFAGQWGLVTLRAYTPKGVKPDRVVLGLQNVMIIGDDNRLGDGGKSDAASDFAGIDELDDLEALFMAQDAGSDDVSDDAFFQ
jgi:hypothetical protein